jgi:glycosyltransferase involved in cell wall biosynthesis
MKHILFINEFFHPDICASAAVAADHLPAIAALRPDWRIAIIAGNRAWDDPSVVYPPTDEYRGVRIVRVDRPPVSRVSLLRRGLGFAAFGRNAIAAADPLPPVDLVVATTAPPQGASIARKIARRHRCPYIYEVLDLYPDLAATLGRIKPNGLIHRLWAARDLRLMRDAAMIVTIAERITERIARTRRIPADKLRTIHDGFDQGRLRLGGPNTFRQRYNPNGRFVIQYAGNMGLSHPFETLLAAAQLLADDPSIQLQFIGDGPQRAYVEANLPPNAQLIGYQPADRLGEVLATADVSLISQHPGMFDQALPYKIYSTLAAGKPCIFVGNHRCEIADWLLSAGAGLHVDQGDVAGLARSIRELKAQPDRLASMGAQAARLFALRFNAENVAARWVEVIQDAVKSRSGPADCARKD